MTNIPVELGASLKINFFCTFANLRDQSIEFGYGSSAYCGGEAFFKAEEGWGKAIFKVDGVGGKPYFKV